MLTIQPDNTKAYNDLTIIDGAKGIAELKLTTQILAVSGILILELEIAEGTDTLSTKPFAVEIIKNTKDIKAVESTNEFSVLTNAIAKIDNLEESYAPRLITVESDLSDTMQQKASISYVDGKVSNMGGIWNFKGNCTYAELQALTSMIKNDAWYVTDQDTNYGYNGTVWFNIGNNISSVKNEVKQMNLKYGLEYKLADIPYNLAPVVLNTGESATYQGWKSCDFQNCSDYDYLNVTSASYTTPNINAISFYDSDYIYISGVYGGTQVNGNPGIYKLYSGKVTVPSNASFYKLSCYKYGNLTSPNSVIAHYKNTNIVADITRINTLLSDMSKIGLPTTIASLISEFVKTSVIKSNGTSATYANWYSSDYIKCSEYSVLKYKVAGYNNAGVILNSISFFDSTYTYISGYFSEGTFGKWIEGEIEVPTNAVYVKGLYYNQITGIPSIIGIADGYIKNLNGVIDDTKVIKSQITTLNIAYKKGLCIGDSLTEGDYGSNPAGTMNVKSLNYPYYLAQFLGIPIVNAGKCGYNTTLYWTNKVKTISFTDVDLILIMLGTNGGLTDTLVGILP